MNQTQILQLARFIMVAHVDINSHRENRDHASQRVMMFSYGRAVGAYAMIGSIVGADMREKVKRLEECYNNANDLTLHKNG